MHSRTDPIFEFLFVAYFLFSVFGNLNFCLLVENASIFFIAFYFIY